MKKKRFSIKTPEHQIKQKKTDLVKKTSSGNTGEGQARTQGGLGFKPSP